MSIVETGGTFLGVLEKREGERVFYNFFPKGKFVENGLHLLGRRELSDLFSGSSPRSRNLWFPFTAGSAYERFLEGKLNQMLLLEIAPRDASCFTNNSNITIYNLVEDRVINKLHPLPLMNEEGRTLEQLQETLEALKQEQEALRGANADVQAELTGYRKEAGITKEMLDRLTERVEEKKNELRKLESEQEALEAYFQDAVQHPWTKLEGLALDEKLAGWMLQELAARQDAPPAPKPLPAPDSIRGQALAQTLCERVQLLRPNYTPLEILNIAVCLTQGFLTVFFGEPGCGKTSICNLFARVLGIKDAARYVPVSVERGWMSKRDFIGYYNPLTKTFDSSNRQVYDALRLLDAEPDEDSRPFVILLDEANLSAMEYYWADFMNLCEDTLTEGRRIPLLDGEGKPLAVTGEDGLPAEAYAPRKIRGTVNLGEDCLEVPDHLRFVATINTDHTTETLSPRLINRAWIVSLPNADESLAIEMEKTEEDLPPVPVSWAAMQETFGGRGAWPETVRKRFEKVSKCLKEQCGIAISPRARRAVERYWCGAREVFRGVWPDKTPALWREKPLYSDPDTAALDYAIAQRVLPQLKGSGERFGEGLEALKETCEGLYRSREILQTVLKQAGDSEYYQFF